MEKVQMRYFIALCMCFFSAAPAFGQKIDEAKLDSAIAVGDSIIDTDPRAFFKNVESLIIYSRDEVIFEKYYHGVVADSLHHIQSQTKSIVALLMGIAMDKGFVTNEDELVSVYCPEYFTGDDSLKSAVTIKDLLTMSAGLDWEEMIPENDSRNDNMKMFRSGRWLEYALSRPMVQKPFTNFKYNSGCPMIVAGIIEKATGMKMDEFAKKYLFGPLGIQDFRWLKDSTGFCHAGGGLFLKPADMLKIGVLVLNNGAWDGRRIVSEEWIGRAMKPYFSTPFDGGAYGYFWWIRDMTTGAGRTTRVLSAEGAGGQKLCVFPEYRLVIAFTERNYSTPQVGALFLRESILPALE
jgi:CubicO group peptidase (beta-lactamase class C family)